LVIVVGSLVLVALIIIIIIIIRIVTIIIIIAITIIIIISWTCCSPVGLMNLSNMDLEGDCDFL
jgi:hypothetical protein